MIRTFGSSRVDAISEDRFDVAESPFWDSERDQLVWVDIPCGSVHRWSSTGAVSTALDTGQPVGAAAPRRRGGLILALRDGFGTVEGADTEISMIAEVEIDDPATRMNDGACDPAGRFWAGTMAYDMAPGCGALYRLDSDLGVTQIIDGVSVSNGLAWDEAGATMYFIDSTSGGVDEFDYDLDHGEVSNRRRLIDIPAGLGLADGMTTDAEGYLWIAVWGGSRVQRYSPSGELDTVVELPTPLITSCALGGPNLDELYVTSARADLSPEERASDPMAGALFRLEVDIPGLPTATFNG